MNKSRDKFLREAHANYLGCAMPTKCDLGQRTKYDSGVQTSDGVPVWELQASKDPQLNRIENQNLGIKPLKL